MLVAGTVADRIGNRRSTVAWFAGSAPSPALIGGWLLTAGLAYPSGFYIFAVVAALGALSIALVNRDPAPSEPLSGHSGRGRPRRGASAAVNGSISSREGNTRCALK